MIKEEKSRSEKSERLFFMIIYLSGERVLWIEWRRMISVWGVRVVIDVVRGVERVLWIEWRRMISVWDAWVGMDVVRGVE